MQKQHLLSPSEESKLMQGIHSGDERALRRLMDLLAAYLVGVARLVLDDLQDAEEVVQDVIFEFWNRSNTIELKSGVVPYLSVAVRNRAISRKRQYGSAKESANTTLDEEEWNAIPNDTVTLDNALEDAETILAVLQCTKDLPEKQSEVIAYRLSGFSIAEIAQKMGISSKGVEINITRAYNSLRKMFAGW